MADIRAILPILKPNVRRKEVRELHEALGSLDFRIDANESRSMRYGKSTRTAVAEFQKRRGLKPTGVVDKETAASIDKEVAKLPSKDKSVVKGILRHADGRPVPGGLVRAFDKSMRSEQLLGEARTDGNGCYEIRYTAAQFARAEKDAADLIVRALGTRGSILSASPVLFKARPVEEVNLTLRAEPTREQLKSLQRLFSLAPPSQGMQTLLESGLQSAQEIAAMSESEFLARFGKALGGDKAARAIHQNAAQHGTLVRHRRKHYGVRLKQN